MGTGRRSAGSSTVTGRPSTTICSGGRPTGPRPKTSRRPCSCTPGAAWSETVLDRDSALPWLLGIADRLVSNTRRRLRRAEALLHRLVSHDEPVGDHADRVAVRVDDERRMSEIHRALARLPRHEREVVELCVWSGLDQQAAAATLKVAVGTVKSRLHRARRRLGSDLVGGAMVAASFSSKNPVNAEEVAR